MPVFIGILTTVVWLTALFTWRLRRTDNKRNVKMNEFLKEENEANAVRRKDIEPEFFFTPDVSALPDDGSAARERVVKRAGLKMLRFPKHLTNLELKKIYGRAQIENIAHYEENFQQYIAALIKWAEDALAAGRVGDAEKLLAQTVELRSEYRKSYTLLADIYAGQNDAAKLNGLYTSADTCDFKDPSVKRHVMNHIDKIKEELRFPRIM